MLSLQRLLPVVIVAIFWVERTSAQDQVIAVGPNGQPMVVTEGGKPAAAGPSRGKPNPNDKAKAENQDGSKEAGDAKEGAPPPPKVIRRDEATIEKSNPDEFNVMVGEDGRVAFEFRNQRWVELVQWLADISDKPLDWLELPGDRVNLRSPGRYTVEETRDLFNRYLLARGYTLLEIDGGLTVAKTETINPAIVPRVDVAKLLSLPPHTFVPHIARRRLALGGQVVPGTRSDDQWQRKVNCADDHQSYRSDGCGDQPAPDRSTA